MQRNNTVNKNKSGFTLLELLVVVGILAALVALALPFYQDYVNQSKLTAAEADIKTFAKALAMYDQLEPKPFLGVDLRILVGTYLQDFRKDTAQQRPIDPWGNEYSFNTLPGTIISAGPDGVVTTGASSRIAAGDDLLATWKPPFFVSGARAVNQNTIEVSFSRKVDLATVAAGDLTESSNSRTGQTFQKVSDTVFRFILNGPLTPGTKTVTVANINALDGQTGFDAKPDTTPGGVVSFTF